MEMIMLNYLYEFRKLTDLVIGQMEQYMNAIPRCENCGWKMNESVCPKCGYVQRGK